MTFFICPTQRKRVCLLDTGPFTGLYSRRHKRSVGTFIYINHPRSLRKGITIRPESSLSLFLSCSCASFLNAFVRHLYLLNRCPRRLCQPLARSLFPPCSSYLILDNIPISQPTHAFKHARTDSDNPAPRLSFTQFYSCLLFPRAFCFPSLRPERRC